MHTEAAGSSLFIGGIMAVQYIIGGAGSGKSTLMYEKILREAAVNPDKRYFIIVPEQFTLQTQRELVTMSSSKAIMNVDVLSFMRLAYRVFDELEIKERLVLEDTGKNMVIRKLLMNHKNELKFFKNAANKRGFTEDLKSLLSEFMQYGITPDRLEEIEKICASKVLAAKLYDTRLVYEAFNEYKREKYIPAEQILEVLSGLIGQSKILDGAKLCFDGFTGFTPIQLKVIDLLLPKTEELVFALTISEKEYRESETESVKLFGLGKDTINRINKLAAERNVGIAKPVTADFSKKSRDVAFIEQNIFRYPVKKSDDTPEDVVVKNCTNPKEEIEYVMLEILAMVRDEGRRYRDIAVILSDMEEYGEQIVDALTAKGVPCFLDSKKSINDNPFIEFIKSAILIAEENFSYEAVMRFLRSGFTGIDIDKTDIFENHILGRGIKGRKAYNASFVKDGEEENAAEEVRIALIALIMPFYEVLKSKKAKAADMVTALYNLIKQADCAGRLSVLSEEFEKKGKKIASKEYAGCFKSVMEILEKLYELLGDEELSAEEFRNILESGFNESKTGFIPPGLDQIIIGDAERTRLADIKVLFCVGFNDGKVPKPSKARGIITDFEREKLKNINVELAPTAKERAFREQFYVYLLFSKPSQKLYVTYSSLTADGKRLKQSYFVERLKNLFENSIEAEKREADLTENIRKDGGISCLLKAVKNRDLASTEIVSLVRYYEENPSDEYKKIMGGFAAKAHGNNIGEYVAEKLYGELKGSVTRLELFSACAYAHFIKHGLKLKERKELELKPVDIGNVLHKVLERFVKKAVEGGADFSSLLAEKRLALRDASIAEALGYGGDIFSYSSRLNYNIERLKRISDRAIKTIIHQLNAGKFVPFAFEEEFITKGFRGRIDRIDSALSDYLPDGRHISEVRKPGEDVPEKVEYIRVIDYKSGTKKLDLNRAYYGLDLQLFTYLNYVRNELPKTKEHKNNIIVPSGAYYFHMDDPVVDFGAGAEAFLKELRLEGITLDSKPFVAVTDRRMTEENRKDFEAGADSSVIKLKINKDGGTSSFTRLYTEKEIASLIDNSELETERFKKRIMGGEIEPKPYSLGGATGCDYCEYRGVCGFDLKVDGYKYRKLAEIDQKEFFCNLETKLGGTDEERVD